MRARGTYATIDNWARQLAPKLPGAAGWVLLELSYQSNYRNVFMQVSDLTRALPYKERAVEMALAYLVQNGHAEKHKSEYCLKGAQERAEKAHVGAHGEARATRTDVRFEEAKNPRQEQEERVPNPAIEMHKKKEVEGMEGTQIKNKAQNSTAPVEASPSQESVLETNTPAAVRSDAPALEKVPRRRAAPAEMPEMPADLAALPGLPAAWAEWLTYRKQRRLSTAPATASGMFVKLREFHADGQNPVEVIQNSIANGWQGLFPGRAAHVLKFQPRPQSTEEANSRASQRAQDIYQMLQEGTHAVF